MKDKIVLLLLFLFSIVGYSQIQNPVLLQIEGFGGNKQDDLFYKAKPNNDGGLILNISTNSTQGNINTSCVTTNNGSSLFRKYNRKGELQWERCMPAPIDSVYQYYFRIADGSTILGGGSLKWDSRDLLIRKEDVNGNILWTKRYGGTGDDFLCDMIATPDGGYYLLGKTNSNDGDVGTRYNSSPFQYDFWVLKIDSNGDKEWSKIIGGTADDRAEAIALAPGGGCYIVGDCVSDDYDCTGLHNPGLYGDAYIARLDASGNKLWHKCLGGNGDGSRATAVTPDSNGCVYIACHTLATGGDISNSPGNGDIWIVHMDSSKNILWEKCYGSNTDNEIPSFISLSKDGTIWSAGVSGHVGGQVDAAFGKGDAWIFNIDINGNFLKGKVLGSDGYDRAEFVYPLEGGEVIAGGTYEAPGKIGGEFPSTWQGERDIFIAIIAPWTTDIPRISKNNIKIFPNPSNNILNIESKLSSKYYLKIYDVSGKVVYQNTIGTRQFQLRIDDWSNGMYYLEFNNDFRYKFLKQ